MPYLRSAPLVLALFLWRAAPGLAQDASAAARQHAMELVRIVASGDRVASRKYVADNFSPDALQRTPLDQRLSTISYYHDRTRGLELKEVQPRNGGGAAAVVQDRLLGNTWELRVWVEPSAPHRVARWGLVSVAPLAEARARTRAQVVAQLRRDVRKACDADAFSGAVLLAHRGEVLYQHACGSGNKDFSAPNRLDTRFNLGSMNKMFTAVAIAQLVEQGALSFEDPLSKFLPDFPTPEVARKIRIKHLLSHTSGLGDLFDDDFWNASKTRFRSVDDYLELARNDSVHFEPGTGSSYSNIGYFALGKIIEILSRKSYSDHVREHI